MTELDENIKSMEQLMQPAEAVVDPTGIEMTEWTFTNDKTNPAISHLFRMFHESVFANKLGVMHALNTEDNKVQTLLVGVEITEDKQVITWPIAKILTEEEQGKYKAPDGNGNYL
jgi:hypothetical protein